MIKNAPFLIVTGNDPLTDISRVTTFGYQINKGFSDLRNSLNELDESLSLFQNVTLGNSLAIIGGVLDTIQDIRTSASPTFAGGTVTGGINLATSSGKVGIGTTTPGTKLSFGTSVANVARIIGTYEAGNSWSGIGMDSATEGIRIAGDRSGNSPIADFGFYSTDGAFTWTNRMRVTGGGNVGIGTIVPYGKLNIHAGSLKVTNSGFVYGLTGSALTLAIDNTGDTYCSILAGKTGDTVSGTLVLQQYGGNVGIQTTSPLAALQIGSTSSGNSRIGGGSWSEYWVAEAYPRVFLSRDGAASGVSALQFGVGATPVDTTIQRLPSGPGVALMGGNVGIGTTAPGAKLDVAGTVNIHSPSIVNSALNVQGGSGLNGGTFYIPDTVGYSCLRLIRNGTGQGAIHFFQGTDESNLVGSIILNASSTAYNTTSDARLKTNFVALQDAGNIIDKVSMGRFDWKKGGKGIGALAQELYKVFPDAVSVGGDDENKQPWGVDYSKLVPLLVAEVKCLRKRVALLEAA